MQHFKQHGKQDYNILSFGYTEVSSKSCIMTWMVAPGGGSGGNSRFQVTGMIEWRQKSKPKKIPGPKFNLPKIPRRISEPLKYPEELHSQDTRGSDAGTITNVQIVLNTQKNPYLNQPTQKNTCQNFSTPKKPEIENFTPYKNPSIIPVTWNLEYPPPPRMVVHFILGLQNKVVVNSYTIQTKEDITAFPWYFQKTTKLMIDLWLFCFGHCDHC